MQRAVAAARFVPIVLAALVMLSPALSGLTGGAAHAALTEETAAAQSPGSASSLQTEVTQSGEAALAHGAGPADGESWSCDLAIQDQCGLPSATPSPLAHRPVAHAVSAHGVPAGQPVADPYALNWSNQSSVTTNTYGERVNASNGGAVAYDPDLESLVLVGGGCTDCFSNELWLYNGAGWFNDTAYQDTLPPYLFMPTATWDPAWNGIILTGGYLENYSASYQTWLFNDFGWYNISSEVNGVDGAPGSVYNTVAYDGAIDALVDVNGCTDAFCDGLLDQTYTLGGPGSNWVLAGAGPNSGTFGGSMAYEATDGVLINYGGAFLGVEDNQVVLNNTWEMTTPGEWTNITTPSAGDFEGFGLFYPYPAVWSSMTWDGQINAIVLVDGKDTGPLNQTMIMGSNLTWYPSDWIYDYYQNAPPAEFEGMMSTNSSAVAPALIGGVGDGNFANDTWVFEIPPEPSLAYVAPNPTDVGVPVLVELDNALGSGSGPFLNFTTANFFGNYTDYYFFESNFTSVDDVVSEFWYAGVSDWLLYGCVTDFYQVDVCSDFTFLTVHANVTAAPSADLVELGTSTEFNSSAGLGTYPYTYVWDFGDGSPLVEGTATDVAHTYAAAGNYTAWVNVTDSVGGYRNTTFKVEVVKDLAVAADTNLTATDEETDVGIPVQFLGDATHGYAPYTSFSWTFGDSGTSTLQDPTHAYAAVGHYTATVTVTDSLDYEKQASVDITVNPTLSGTVGASSLTPHAAASDTFTATPTGGSAPYTYAWTFGDGATATGASPSYAYPNTGTYTVTVVIKDAFHESKTLTLSVTVSAAPTSSLLAGLTSGTGLYALVAIVVVVILAIAFLVTRRRKKEPASAPPAAWQGAPPGGAAGTPPPGANPPAGGSGTPPPPPTGGT